MSESKNYVAMIWRIMHALESDSHTEEIMQNALTQLKTMLEVSDAALWLLNEQDQRMYIVSYAGENNMSGYGIDADTGLPGEVIRGGEEILVADTSGDTRFPNGNDEITGVPTKNAFFVPMKYIDRPIGVLQLVNKPGGTYDEDETKICTTFCGLIAMVIDEKGFVFTQDTDREVIMSFSNVTKDYPSGGETLHVLKGVNLDIYENEFLVILGESGCGKSTMLNIIGGMDRMTTGTMMLDGADFSHPTEKELDNYRRDYIGFIFQAYNLMPNLTALENIEYIAENCPSHGDPKVALDMVGLSSRAKNYPSMMSGGQQQRVSIARAIVKNPRVILADEPTAALDFTTGQEVLRVIEKLVKENKTTVVMVTHNVEIAKMANRVVRFKAGKIESIQENAWPVSADDLIW